MTDYLKSQWMMITHHHHLPPYIWTKRLQPGGPPDKPQQEQLFIKQPLLVPDSTQKQSGGRSRGFLRQTTPWSVCVVPIFDTTSLTSLRSRHKRSFLKNHHAPANGRQMIKKLHNVQTLGVDDNCVLVQSRTSGVDLLRPPADPRRPTLASPHVWSIHSQNVGCPLNRFRRLADDQLSAFQKQSAELEPGRPAQQEKAGSSPLSAPPLFRRDFFLLIAQQNPPEDAQAAHQGSAPPRPQISGRKVHRMEESNGSFHPFGGRWQRAQRDEQIKRKKVFRVKSAAIAFKRRPATYLNPLADYGKR
jgi:hypothetical protein